jgi:type I restriction enzyme S subunit
MGVNAVPKYRFEEIAYNSTEKKIPSEDDKHTYIGLEHLDSGTMTVTRWGSEVAPIGEKLVMRKGDVLFGKRRAYQKKVAIAPFDGIFSAHGMVLRPKEKAVTKEFFPLFISSDYFLNEAIRISVGSLSPTINWRDLKELEFSLPTIEEQSRISPLIWAAIRAKEAYKKMLESTDNLVKSQFIEMFTDTPKGKLSDIATITMGQSPDGKTYNTDGNGMPFYQGKTEFGDLYIGDATTWTTAPSRIAEANDVLMSVRAPVGSLNEEY